MFCGQKDRHEGSSVDQKGVIVHFVLDEESRVWSVVSGVEASIGMVGISSETGFGAAAPSTSGRRRRFLKATCSRPRSFELCLCSGRGTYRSRWP